MWSFGYDDPFNPNGVEPVTLGDASTFPLACDELLENVEKMAADAEEYQTHHFAQVINAIRTIAEDPGVRYDSDQWEDKDFTDEIGEITYWVMEDV